MTEVRNNKCVGILGAGQLSMLLCQAAKGLGIETKVWGNTSSDIACKYCDEYAFGTFRSSDFGEFFESCDAITLESEFHDSSYLKEVLGSKSKDLVPLIEHYEELETKLKEKAFFKDVGFDVIPFDMEFKGEYPSVIKVSSGGYDGKGNFVVKSDEELKITLELLEEESFFFEPFLNIQRELAITAVSNGESLLFFPLVETIQENSICTEVRVISDAKAEEKLQTMIKKVFEKMPYRGTLAFEFIEDTSGRVFFNESSPRVHNSSHYTSDLCETSQFENHLRASLGMALGQTQLKFSHGGMINIIAGENWEVEKKEFSRIDGLKNCKVYLYGKEEGRLGRKMGHINYWGNSKSESNDIYQKIKGSIK